MRLFYLCFLLHAFSAAHCLAQIFQCDELLPQVVMYPGDTNNDGVCNQYDLLPIGIAYGEIGPLRPDASLEWMGQFGPAWHKCLPVSQIDLAFVDCDGHDTINALDIEAIPLNYDKVQLPSNPAFPPPMPYPPLLTVKCDPCAQPVIEVTFDRDTVNVTDVFFAYVRLVYDTPVPPSLGALGIAFNVDYYYTNEVVDELTEVIPDDNPDSRMHIIATHTEVVSSDLLPPAGRIGFAAAGRGANVFFDSDTLFTIRFIIEDMIVRAGEDTFSLRISDVLFLNEREELVGYSIATDSVIVKAGEPARNGPRVFLSPNPARETLGIESPESPLERIEIYSPGGLRAVSADPEGQNRFDLPLAALPPGLWIAVVQTRKGVAVKKFVKQD